MIDVGADFFYTGRSKRRELNGGHALYLVYRGGDSSTEGESCLRRGRLIYGGEDSSTEGETRLQRGRLFYVKSCPFMKWR
jgi:hypothetical protein